MHGRLEPSDEHDLGSRTVHEVLTATASEAPVPGAASSAALAVALGAALVTGVARRSRSDWRDATGVAAQGDALRRRALALSGIAAVAYERALDRLSRAPSDGERARDALLGEALSQAADASLRIGEAALDVAELGALAAECGDQSVRAEAVAAAFLAEAGARSAATIVEVNLAITESDERIERGRRLASRSSDIARRAAASV